MASPPDTTVYFAVPTHYTIGECFDSFDAAVAHARSKIVHFDDLGYDSREFVDIRVSTATTDKSVHRVEVFREGTT